MSPTIDQQLDAIASRCRANLAAVMPGQAITPAAEAGLRTTIACVEWAKASHSAMLGIEIVSAWEGKQL